MSQSQSLPEEAQPRGTLRWGTAALACVGLAVFSANIAGIIPAQFLNTLHAPRSDAASLQQLRSSATDMRQELAAISSQHRALVTRLNLIDDDSSATLRRLAAVEVSLPLLIESLPTGADIDRSLLTASIGDAMGTMLDAEGGSILVRQTPLTFARANGDQPLPPPLPVPQTIPEAPGVTIGGAVSQNALTAYHRAVSDMAGTLFLGTEPLMIEDTPGQARLILGPLADTAAAEIVCSHLIRIDIACAPPPYEGTPLHRQGQ